MADKKITDLYELSETPSDNDILVIADISETQDLNGDSYIDTAKKITVSNLFTYQNNLNNSALADNLLINPNPGAIMQRQNPDVASGRADDTYGPDRWYLLTQTAAVNNVRISGDTQRYAWRITQNQTAAQRFGFAQIVEGVNCHHLKNQNISFAGRIRVNSGVSVYATILEWTGVEDVVTSDFVNNWLSVDNSTGNFLIASNYRVSTVQTLTPPSGMWSGFHISGSMSSGLHNVVVGLWTKESGVTNFTLDSEAMQLYPGTTQKTFRNRPFGLELSLSQRYYEKTFNLNAAPLNNMGYSGAIVGITAVVGQVGPTDQWNFHVQKRTTPTITTYNPGAGAAGNWRNINNNGDETPNIANPGENGIGIGGDSANAVQRCFIHATADAEL